MLSTEGRKSPLRKDRVCSWDQGAVHGSQHPHTPGQVTAAPTTYILAFHTVVVLEFALQIVNLQGYSHAVVLFLKDRKLDV